MTKPGVYRAQLFRFPQRKDGHRGELAVREIGCRPGWGFIDDLRQRGAPGKNERPNRNRYADPKEGSDIIESELTAGRVSRDELRIAAGASG